MLAFVLYGLAFYLLAGLLTNGWIHWYFRDEAKKTTIFQHFSIILIWPYSLMIFGGIYCLHRMFGGK